MEIDEGLEFIKEDYSLGGISYVISSQKKKNANHDSVVFVHGLASTEEIWDKVYKEIAPFFNVYLLRLPWNGKEDVEYHGRDYLLNWFYEVINNLKKQEQRLHLVGHSFGAMMCMHYYLNYSSEINKMVLCSPIWRTEKSDGISWNEFILFVNSYKESLSKLVKANMKSKKNEDLVDAIVNSIVENLNPRPLLQYFDCLFAIADYTIAGDHKNVLIINGSDDNIVNPDNSNYIHRNLLNSQLKNYDNIDHYPMFENTKEFVNDLSHFLLK